MDEIIHSLALQILDQQPDPVVRYRLLQDVIRLPPEAPELCRARMELDQGRWINELVAEQRVEGSWDFGPRSCSTTFFPLSENWKTSKKRQFDWTTRILILFAGEGRFS